MILTCLLAASVLVAQPAPSVEKLIETDRGELVVDYGSAGKRTYRRGDSLVEALAWPHRGRNAGRGPVRILVVYAGAEGVSNAQPVEAN
jgi:hypothetical protein